MNKWIVYHTLKNKKDLPNAIKTIEKLDAKEVKEGTIEYLTMIEAEKRMRRKE